MNRRGFLRALSVAPLLGAGAVVRAATRKPKPPEKFSSRLPDGTLMSELPGILRDLYRRVEKIEGA